MASGSPLSHDGKIKWPLLDLTTVYVKVVFFSTDLGENNNQEVSW